MRGFRFRVDMALPSNPRYKADILFPAQRIAVFIDGCFWHFCPLHGEVPKRNAAWWYEKFLNNRRRDALATKLYISEGWRVLRFWSHEHHTSVADRIAEEIRRAAPCNPGPRRKQHSARPGN